MKNGHTKFGYRGIIGASIDRNDPTVLIFQQIYGPIMSPLHKLRKAMFYNTKMAILHINIPTKMKM